jgi:hypothetical protein
MSRTSALPLILTLLFATLLRPRSGPAPRERAARIVSLTGQASVMKDSAAWVLKIGDTVQVQQLFVTGSDGFAVLQVSDGSLFEVYPNSRITFRNKSGDWKDLVDLWLAPVKERIQRFGGKPNPDGGHPPAAVISVRG